VKRHNVTIIDENVEAVLLRERVELVLEILSVFNIFFKTEDGPLLEVDRLANNLAQNVGVIEHLLYRRPRKVLAAR
jgi:hypothetical protein